MKTSNCILVLGIFIWANTVANCQSGVAKHEFMMADSRNIVPITINVGDRGLIYSDSDWGIVILEVVQDGVPVAPRRGIFCAYSGGKETIRVDAQRYIYLEDLKNFRNIPADSDGFEQNEYALNPKFRELIIKFKARFPNGSFGEITTLRVVSMDRLIDLIQEPGKDRKAEGTARVGGSK